MPSKKATDDFFDNCGDLPSLGITELISIFLDECGERATWEEWCTFLHKYQEKGFDWIDDVN